MTRIKYMFNWRNNHSLENEISERARLDQMTEKELLIEMIIKLDLISQKCEEIGRKIVIYSN